MTHTRIASPRRRPLPPPGHHAPLRHLEVGKLARRDQIDRSLTFDDVAGCDAARGEVSEIVSMMLNPKVTALPFLFNPSNDDQGHPRSDTGCGGFDDA